MNALPSTNLRRYLALWFPFLQVDRLVRARLRSGGAPLDAPLVLVEPFKGSLRLAAVSREAFALGLRPGFAMADACARIANLIIVDHDPKADAALLVQMAEDCARWTPRVALDPPHGLLFDITGCVHLFGGEDALLMGVEQRFLGQRIEARGAIAGTPDAARALARFGAVKIVPAGEDEAVLRTLPIAALDVPEETRRALSRAGLKRIADLADRPSQPLVARFGENLSRCLRRVLGREDCRIAPQRPLPACLVEQQFAEPLAHIEVIENELHRLIERIGCLLEERGEGGRLFEASFFRTDAVVRHVTVATSRPTRERSVIARLFREKLDTLTDPIDPGYGFDLIRLTIPVVEHFPKLQTCLDGRGAEESAFIDLVDRLIARFGDARVLRFVSTDTHDPCRAFRYAQVSASEGEALPRPSSEPDETLMRPFRLFDPPQPIETIAEIPDGAPARFRWHRVTHEVSCAEGPERIAPEWWRHGAGPTRDYYRVEDTVGHRFWLFRAGLYGHVDVPRWYVHGLFA